MTETAGIEGPDLSPSKTGWPGPPSGPDGSALWLKPLSCLWRALLPSSCTSNFTERPGLQGHLHSMDETGMGPHLRLSVPHPEHHAAPLSSATFTLSLWVRHPGVRSTGSFQLSMPDPSCPHPSLGSSEAVAPRMKSRAVPPPSFQGQVLPRVTLTIDCHSHPETGCKLSQVKPQK